MNATIAQLEPIFKELYENPTQYMQDVVYPNNPTLALLKKKDGISSFGGKYVPVPIISGYPQGLSQTFSKAQANQTAVVSESFFMKPVQGYQLVSLENLTIESSLTDAAAFVSTLKLTVDKGLANLTKDIAFKIFGDGTGSRGVIGAYANSSGAVTITLTERTAIVAFEIGMRIVASASTTAAVSADYITITAVNRSAGIISGTASTGGALSGTWAVNAVLVLDGDRPSAGASNTSQYLCMTGFQAWIPKVAPTSGDNFWGVDRSIDTDRLAGVRYDGSALPIEEAFNNAMALVDETGGKPDFCVMNNQSYAALLNSVGAKVQYVQVNHDVAELAFEGLLLQTSHGPVTIIADRYCPPKTAYLLSRDYWELRSNGPMPRIIRYQMEGLDGLRAPTADALEVRMGYYGNLICSAPAWNAVITLSS